MNNGLSLHIGVNNIDKTQYNSEWTPLVAAIKDAIAMEQLATQYQFKTKLLLDYEATTDNFLNFLDSASETLSSGDFLLVSFSGHGSFITDPSSNRFESPIDLRNGIDHTLCFYDKMLIDDRIHLEFQKFETGVRILFIFDSCYSAGMIDTHREVFAERTHVRSRLLEQSALLANYNNNKAFYDNQKKLIEVKKKNEKNFDLILLAACEANEKAYEDDQHGFFTSHLLKTWNNKKFSGDIIDLFELTKLSMKQSGLKQTPRLLPYSRFTNKQAFVI